MTADKLAFYFVSLILNLFNFTIFASQENKDYVYEIERSFAEQMFTEFGLQLSGSQNRMHEKVDELGLKFLTYRRATIMEARALHLLVMEKFVHAVNSHEKIQPYLASQPFSFKQATILINFEGIQGRYSDASITYMFNVPDLASSPSRNHILYFSHDPFKNKLIGILSEPYEEAIMLNATSPIDPNVHQGNEYEEEMDRMLAAFSKESNEKYGLSVWHIGGNWQHGIEDIGATIKLNHFANRAEARQLLIEVSEKLLSVINCNEKVRPYLKAYPFPASLLKLAFHFEDTSANPLPDVRLEKMTLENKVITYIQETILPIAKGEDLSDSEYETLPLESYEEAEQIVKNHPVNLNTPSFFGRVKKWFVNLVFSFSSSLSTIVN
ncbi:MAG: hypothetical protein H0V82_11400 [Candidatus Protochlamydia sp.]|nr:hypothetical protein [Candidatus Protochlamydia sp.]